MGNIITDNIKTSQAKFKESAHNGPIGFVIGAALGWVVAKKVGYEKTLTVSSFIIVGGLIGSAIGYRIKNK